MSGLIHYLDGHQIKVNKWFLSQITFLFTEEAYSGCLQRGECSQGEVYPRLHKAESCGPGYVAQGGPGQEGYGQRNENHVQAGCREPLEGCSEPVCCGDCGFRCASQQTDE